MAKSLILVAQVLIASYFLDGNCSASATRRLAYSTRITSFDEFLHQKAIKHAFMKRILDKLGMKNRPPPIPFDKRKQNLPRPLIDGGLAASTIEDPEKDFEIVVGSEEEGGKHCQDRNDCFVFKLNHYFLQNYKIEEAALHIHNKDSNVEGVGAVKTIVLSKPAEDFMSEKQRDSEPIERKTTRIRRDSASADDKGRDLVSTDEKATRTRQDTEFVEDIGRKCSSEKNGKAKKFDDTVEKLFDPELYHHWLSKNGEKADVKGTLDVKKLSLDLKNENKKGSIIAQVVKRKKKLQGSENDDLSETNSVKDKLAREMGQKEKINRERREVEEYEREEPDAKENADANMFMTPSALRLDVFVPANGWLKVPMSDLVEGWLHRGSGEAVRHGLHISCEKMKINTKARYRPFIVLKLKEKVTSKGRNKRSYATKCVPGYDKCCLRKLFVKFKDINWHDWIIEPDGYQVNYCEGRCTGTGIMSAHSHAFIKRTLIPNTKACCIPLKFDALTLLHYDEDGLIHNEPLPNMSVLECGCV